MAYQVLARKWRPQDFDGVVGQEPIVTALRNAITEGRIAQAYLFSGIRGVGKTSVARILAKALNCENGPTASPCNKCVSCTEITASSGTNLDVHEIDAATHSKVEQVRDLTEGLKYGPARDRYKVVIIDEIHRLSRQAFDALLKIVEEPPPHLVFIFATTESEAVPVTILSRCQEFRFRRVPSQALVDHLKVLSQAEKIEVGDSALRLIARAGDGSVRDSVALLDQLATFGSGRIDDEEAARVLGGVDHAIFLRLLSSILSGDSAVVASIVREIEDQGWDPRHVYGEFLTYSRDALHLALGGDAAEIELPEEEIARLAKVARAAKYENLLRLCHQLLASENTVRRSEMGSLALEICWLRAAELPKLMRVESILGGREPEGSDRLELPEPAPPAPAPDSGKLFKKPPPKKPPPKKSPPKKSSPKKSSRNSASSAASPVAPPPPAPSAPEPEFVPEPEPPAELPPPATVAAASRAAEVPAPSAAPSGQQSQPSEPSQGSKSESDSAPTTGDIDKFLNEISRRKLPLAAHLREAQRISLKDNKVLIHCPADDDWLNIVTLNRKSNLDALTGAIEATFGPGVGWKLVECDDEPPAAAEATAVAEVDETVQDPRVQKVLDIFGGHAEAAPDS